MKSPILFIKSGKRFLMISTLFLPAWMMTGCLSVYTPTTPNTPLFTNKNELQAEGSVFLNGVNVKTAYTPIRHLAFQVNAQYARGWSENYHKYAEVALGYYYGFKNNFSIECYGGYGMGASCFSDGLFANETLLNSASGSYEKWYMQLNFGNRQLWRRGGMGLCARLANVRYTYTDANFRNLINTTSDHHSIEPYWFIYLNLSKHLDFTAHAGLTLIEGLSNEPYQATMSTNVLNTGIGFKYTFRYSGKKSNQEKTNLTP